MKTLTFTAKITVPDNANPRYIPNAAIQNGVLVQITQVGRGQKTERAVWSGGDADIIEEYERYEQAVKPYFCKAKFSDETSLKEAMSLHEACAKKGDWTECFARFKHAMLTMGDNGNGYIVEDAEQFQNETTKLSTK